jgi:hypothetical protein
MGKLEAALGFGWGAGAFLGGCLVLSDDYGSSHPTVIFAFLFTASLGVLAVVGYMGLTERILHGISRFKRNIGIFRTRLEIVSGPLLIFN